ncbi:MAG: hypothetical protein ACKOE4_08985 [Candidatus Kapaibacterium sp.]
MTDPSVPISRLLRATESQWRWFRLLRQTLIFSSVVTGIVLLLGVGLLRGWLPSGGPLVVLCTTLVAGALLTWLCLALVCAVAPENHAWLAQSLERVHTPLLDRLNTLTFLQQGGQRSHPYAEQIERQAASVVQHLPARFPFSWAPLRAPAVTLAVLLLVTAWFYTQLRPWERVRDVAHEPPPPADASSEIPQLSAPPTPEARAETPWGEVRIVRPGVDLRATPLDVIPLRIEAVASRSLAELAWFVSVNAGEELRQEISGGENSRFGASEPELDLQSLGVREWDVVSYYATATCADGGPRYQSRIYFVEVFPFRNELKQIPGGPQGDNTNVLRELTTLIERQQHVIRKTREQQDLGAAAGADGQRQREALAHVEAELNAAGPHLSAELQSLLDQTTMQQLQPLLNEARSSLQEAENLLLGNTLPPAIKGETAALAALAKARQQFQTALREPADDAAGTAEADEPRPTAEAPAETEPQPEPNSLAAALEQQVEQYAKIEQDPEQFTPDEIQQTAQQTRELLQRLEKFEQQQSAEEQSASELHQELNQKNRQEFTSQCDKLCQSPDGSGKQQASKTLRQGLQELSRAMAADRARRTAERQATGMQEKLADMESRQAGLRSARQEVQKLLAEERQLEQQAEPSEKKPGPQLAERQRNLRDRLNELSRQDPRSFAPCARQCESASSAMGQAAESLQSGQPKSQELGGLAARELQQLDDALEREQQGGRLAEAHQLKRLLDQQIRQLQQAAQPGNSSAQLDQSAQRGRAITAQLKQIAEEQPTRQQFGEPLREALRDELQHQIDQAAAGVCPAQGSADQGQAAGKLRQRLEDVSRAFEASVPGQRGRTQRQSLAAEGPQAIEEGLRRLESLTRRQAGRNARSQRGDPRLGQDALDSFEAGLETTYGHDEQTQQAIRNLERELKRGEQPVDAGLIQELLRGIQRTGRETVTTAQPDQTQKTQIDPARLPPAYRKSIERYYQKLSEQR